jgi:hypothetical protein
MNSTSLIFIFSPLSHNAFRVFLFTNNGFIERQSMHRELLAMKDGIIAEATQEYQVRLAEVYASVRNIIE